MVERCDHALELHAFSLFQSIIDILEFTAERITDNVGSPEAFERIVPDRRQLRRVGVVGLPIGHWTRLDLICNAVPHAREDRRKNEVGVGIGTSNAMLDARPEVFGTFLTRRIAMEDADEEFSAQASRSRFSLKTLILPRAHSEESR